MCTLFSKTSHLGAVLCQVRKPWAHWISLKTCFEWWFSWSFMKRNKRAFFCADTFQTWRFWSGEPLLCHLSWSKGKSVLLFPWNPYLLVTFILSFPKTLHSFLSVGSRDPFCFPFLYKTATTHFVPRASFLHKSKWNANILPSNNTFILLFIHFLIQLKTYLPNSICLLTVLQPNGFLFSTPSMQNCFLFWSHIMYCSIWVALPFCCFQGWLLILNAAYAERDSLIIFCRWIYIPAR